MKKLLVCLSLCAAALPAFAGPYADAFGQCLTDSTTGRDRTELARWIFTVMAQHPSMHEFITISPEQQDEINRQVGALYNRLLLVDCKQQAVAAAKREGPGAVGEGFKVLGGMAFQELTNNPAVKNGFDSFQQYVDTKDISRLGQD